MEEAPIGILSPFFSDLLTLLSIILSVILLIALSYIWSTQRQDREVISRLSTLVKNLSNRIKELENPTNEKALSNEKGSTKEAEKISKAVPMNIPDKPVKGIQEVSEELPKIPKALWATFLVDYNHIAESMAVPGQLKACENFVAENKLKILVYAGNMNFISAPNVNESRFWAWKIEEVNKFAVVPNPMIKYDEELHSHSGMKETFASNYESGNYTKYFVELPAILDCDENDKWKILEPGVINLRR